MTRTPLIGFALWVGCTPGGGDTETPADTDTDGTIPTETGPETLFAVDVDCPGNIIDEPKAPCFMSIDDGDGVVYDGPAGFELRGRSSLTFPKPQYSLELRSYGELPVWPGSIWRYLDDGSDPGTAWRAPGFDDTAWSSGAAPLGYGEDYLQTTVGSAGVTTYYRYAFPVTSPELARDARLGVMRSDGVAVYLNGVQILRDRLPPDATFATWANEDVPEAEQILWTSADIDPALLVQGTNVLAVEVHQDEDEPTDLRLDVYLEAFDSHDVDLYGMGKDEDWILNGQYVDRSLMHNRLAFDLFQSFGGKDWYATQTRFGELWLNGDYEGVYTLGEKIDTGPGRLKLDDGARLGDSFVIKLDDGVGFHANAVGRGTWQMVYPNEPDEATEAVVSQFLEGFEGAVEGPDPGNPSTGVFNWLDMDSAVDWVLLEEFMKNADAYQLSVFLWKEPDGKMHFSPWDLDLSMGYPNTDCGFTGWNARDYASPEGVKPIAYIQAMAAVPAFHDALVARWAELRQGPMAEQAIRDRIAEYDVTLAPAIQDNFDRWPIGSIAFSTDYVDNWLCPVSSYEEEHQRMLDYVSGRLGWMDANIGSF